MRQRSLLAGFILAFLVVVLLGGSAWWWRSKALILVSELPSQSQEQHVFKVSVDVGEQAIESAHIILNFPQKSLQITDQDNFASGIQIIPISDFNSMQEMKIVPEEGKLGIRVYNQRGIKLKGKINLLTFQAKPLQSSLTLRLDCGASALYTDYEGRKTLKTRCQGVKVRQ